MLGAIAGDVVGSVFEREPFQSPHFQLFVPGSRFTDDTVLTVAQMDQILHDRPWQRTLVEWFRLYPRAGYGGNFARWCLAGGGDPYQSWGNGSAMRVSPVGFAYDDLETVLARARDSAVVTHSHEEGIKGAQATAAAVFLARTGAGKDAIREEIEGRFGYALGRRLDEIRPGYRFDVSCQGSVPESLIAFLEADGVEQAIRNAVSLGGDADTMACIAGGVAEAFYGPPTGELLAETWARLDEMLRGVVRAFYARYQSTVSLPSA